MTQRYKQPLWQEIKGLPRELASARLGWRRTIMWGVVLGLLFTLASYGSQVMLTYNGSIVPSWNLG